MSFFLCRTGYGYLFILNMLWGLRQVVLKLSTQRISKDVRGCHDPVIECTSHRLCEAYWPG